MHNKLIGVISLNAKGKGFVRIEGREDDVPVEPEDVSIALPGDTVEIETYTGFKGLTYGHVTAIIERKKDQFVGTIYKHPDTAKTGFVLVPDDRRANVTIALISGDLEKLKENLKAIAKITDWKQEDGRAAKGELLRVIGEKGDNNAEMESIVLERGFDTTFDTEVLKDAEEAAAEFSSLNIPADELAMRRDMRGVFTCTIDPVDAKDFDDALSIRPIEDNLYEIGIHIADVAHYVRPGTALDLEARRRAFSVYLVVRTTTAGVGVTIGVPFTAIISRPACVRAPPSRGSPKLVVRLCLPTPNKTGMETDALAVSGRSFIFP
jgi:VacB/RNase II family 3'-5' exoribonuclease